MYNLKETDKKEKKSKKKDVMKFKEFDPSQYVETEPTETKHNHRPRGAENPTGWGPRSLRQVGVPIRLHARSGEPTTDG